MGNEGASAVFPKALLTPGLLPAKAAAFPRPLRHPQASVLAWLCLWGAFPSCPSCWLPGASSPQLGRSVVPCRALPSPPQSALSHSPWQPCLRPQEASRASEGPPSPGRAGQMEARLRSNNHGNRREVGRAVIWSWHREPRGSAQLSLEGEPWPLAGQSGLTPVRRGSTVPRGLSRTQRLACVPGAEPRACRGSAAEAPCQLSEVDALGIRHGGTGPEADIGHRGLWAGLWGDPVCRQERGTLLPG